jgi:hypothetical protein
MAIDEDRALAMAAEIAVLEQLQGWIDFAFAPRTLFQIAAMLQLAKRHPDIGETNRETADKFLAFAREAFQDSPTILECLRQGHDPRFDT